MKTRKLKDIVVKEISLVDRPANKEKFLFFKQQGKPDDGSLEKADLKINIESDGTAGGTKVTINDKELEELKSFNFSFWETQKDDSPVSCSYSKTVASEDGFKRTETFYLSKGEIVMDKEIEKLLRKFFGDEKMEFEKVELNDKTVTLIKDSLTVINQYTADLPTDLKDAIGNIAKHAGQGYKQEVVEKAGAKFSKEVLAKLKAIVNAAKALQEILPVEKTEKADSEEVSGLRKQVEELAKTIEKLGTAGASGNEAEPKSELEKVTKALAEVAKRLETVEKGSGVQKSIPGQDGGGGGSEGQKWPSFQPAQE